MKKIERIAKTTFNVVYIFSLLLVSFITIISISAMITGRQASIFGYSVFELQSSSMEQLGFNEGDYVITKQIKSSDQITTGTIIAFYLSIDGTPISKTASLKTIADFEVFFHEVISSNENGEYITKSSEESYDPYPIPFDAVIGVYAQPNAFVGFFVRLVLIDYNFFFWIIALLALTLFKQLFGMSDALYKIKLKAEVIRGRRSLLDKKCLQTNIFESFAPEGKQKLIASSPKGLDLIYDYLLNGSITEVSNPELCSKLENKRYGTVDVLTLVSCKHAESKIDIEEFVDSMPNGKPSKYSNDYIIRDEFSSTLLSLVAFLCGAILFSVFYFLMSGSSDYLNLAPWYEIILVAFIPLIVFIGICVLVFMFVLKISESQKTKLQIAALPEHYLFLLKPAKYTNEEIQNNVHEIESALLAHTIVDNSVISLKDYRESETDADHTAFSTPTNIPKEWCHAQYTLKNLIEGEEKSLI